MLQCLQLYFYPDIQVLEIEDDTPDGCYDTISALNDSIKIFLARGQKTPSNDIKNQAFALNKFDIDVSRGKNINDFLKKNYLEIFYFPKDLDKDLDEDEGEDVDEGKDLYNGNFVNCLCCQGFMNKCACVTTKGYIECMKCQLYYPDEPDERDETNETNEPDETDENDE